MNAPPITQIEMNDKDLAKAEKMAVHLGYHQTAYTSSSALWGLFCLPENPSHHLGPYRGGCIVKTREFGLMFMQDAEDIRFNDEGTDNE